MLARAWRSLWCRLSKGGHEYHLASSATRVYQECLWCHAQTRGWELQGGGQPTRIP